ncbi:hypothetical protein [Sorangium sp. So ce1182]|uniref:hypothetical protein n=1 Tax=Sorangium sp. So ce1182 TaxID=3133334 RepID=UPI003F6215FF
MIDRERSGTRGERDDAFPILVAAKKESSMSTSACSVAVRRDGHHEEIDLRVALEFPGDGGPAMIA